MEGGGGDIVGDGDVNGRDFVVASAQAFNYGFAA